MTQPQANVYAIQGGKEQIVQVRNNFHTCSELQWLSNKRHQRDLKDHQHFKDHNDLKHLKDLKQLKITNIYFKGLKEFKNYKDCNDCKDLQSSNTSMISNSSKIKACRLRSWSAGRFSRVSVQGVKSLGSHFACLCRGFEFYEVNKEKFCYYFSKRKWKYFYTFYHFYSEKSSNIAK